MGFATQAKRCQDLFLAGNIRAAAAAVPLEFVDQTCLLGPPERIAERLGAFAAAGVTTLNVACLSATQAGRLATLRTVVSALDAAGLGD
jgi:alkanesulfonate monooxygenase SsuD/methylene tetrahydromethanopterin reductase-like flavin-dependent oxidoreductase (luciferase family)